MSRAIFLASVVLFGLGVNCGTQTPKVVKTETQAACTVIEALAGDATVDSICASAPELAEIVASIIGSRGGAARKVGPCKSIAGSSVCATKEELATAFALVRAKRGDGGAP